MTPNIVKGGNLGHPRFVHRRVEVWEELGENFVAEAVATAPAAVPVPATD